MTEMDFFRRPQLAGKALQLLPAGSVRGSLRRSDPDGTSIVPYFPGVAAGQTLTLNNNGTSVTITLSGPTPTYQSILNNINAVLTTTGVATDEDGSIRISTTAPGGFIEVTGGTAAKAIGFDISRGRIRSAGGDLPSTPERRSENPFGAALPMRGEDLTVNSINKAFGRMAANMDVLFSEHARLDARMVKVASTSTAVTNPSATTSLIQLPNIKIFTKLNIPRASLSPEALAPFVQLIDPVTNLPPAHCRVVDIVRGNVTGSAPYAQATTYAGAGSVACTDLVKESGTISEILDGRVVRVSGATFSPTLVGDWVRISGATNASPFSNNGYRWVVEEVIDAEHLALRPMSQSELVYANPAVSFTDVQPLVELNDRKAPTEIFGSLEVRNGAFTDGVKLVVQPPIPEGVKYDVWVTMAMSLRQANAGSDVDYVSVAQAVSQLDPVPNGIIKGFRVTGGGASVTVGEGLIRLHGKILRIPAKTFTSASFSGNGTYTLYFDESKGIVELDSGYPTTTYVPETDPAGILTDPTVRLLTRFTVTGANVSAHSVARYSSFGTERVTVGQGGQFSTLFDAVEFVNAVAFNYAEDSDDTAFGKHHFELMLLADVTETKAVTVHAPGLRITAVNPMITWSMNNTFTLKDCYHLQIEGVRIEHDATRPLIRIDSQTATKSTDITLRQILRPSSTRAPTPANSFVVEGVNGGRLGKLVMEDCYFELRDGIVKANGLNAQQEIFAERCVFDAPTVTATTRMFTNQAGTNWDGKGITIRDSEFNGWAHGSSTIDGLMVFASADSRLRVVLENNFMNWGSFGGTSNTILLQQEDYLQVYLAGNVGTAFIPRICKTSDRGSCAIGNSFMLKPENSEALHVPVAMGNYLFGVTATAPGTLLSVSESAVGNRVHGFSVKHGILVSGNTEFSAAISGNIVVDLTVTVSGIHVADAVSAQIFGNSVSVVSATPAASFPACISLANGSSHVVSNNKCAAAGAFGLAISGSAANGIISGNVLSNTTNNGTFAAITLRNGSWQITGNRISGTQPGYVGLRTNAASATLDISDCTFEVPVSLDLTQAPSRVTVSTCRFSETTTLASVTSVANCRFSGAVTLVGNGHNISESVFSSTITSSGSGFCTLIGCTVTGAINVSSFFRIVAQSCEFRGAVTSAASAEFKDNNFSSNLTLPARIDLNEVATLRGNVFNNGTVSLSENLGRLLVSDNSFEAVSLSVTKTSGGTGFTSFVGNDLGLSNLTLTQGAGDLDAAIDLFSNNRVKIASATGDTFRSATVTGNEWRGGPLTTFINCIFEGNRVVNHPTALTECLVTGNQWFCETTGTLTLTGCTTSNNKFFADAGFTVAGISSSNDTFYTSPSFTAGPVSLTGGVWEADVQLGSLGVGSEVALSGVTNTNVVLGSNALSVRLGSCSILSLQAPVWVPGMHLKAIGCRFETVIIGTTSLTNVKPSSALFEGCTFVSSSPVTIIGPGDLRFVNGGQQGGTTSLTLSNISDLELSNFTIEGTTAGQVTNIRLRGSRWTEWNIAADDLFSAHNCEGDIFPDGIDVFSQNVDIVGHRGVALEVGASISVSIRSSTFDFLTARFQDACRSVFIANNNCKAVSILPDGPSGSTVRVREVHCSGNTITVDNSVLASLTSHNTAITIGTTSGLVQDRVDALTINNNNIVVTSGKTGAALGANITSSAISLNSVCLGGTIVGNLISIPKTHTINSKSVSYRFINSSEATTGPVVVSGNSMLGAVWDTTLVTMTSTSAPTGPIFDGNLSQPVSLDFETQETDIFTGTALIETEMTSLPSGIVDVNGFPIDTSHSHSVDLHQAIGTGHTHIIDIGWVTNVYQGGIRPVKKAFRIPDTTLV